MGFNWNEAADREGGGESEKIPDGFRGEVTITKVVHGKKDGTEFTSKNGDPQIMLVFADGDDREAAQMYTLTEKAAWTLAKVLKAAGAKLDQLTGVEPRQFAEQPEWAKKVLEGRSLRVSVAYKLANNGNSYPQVQPLFDESPISDEQQFREDDIPF